MAIRRTRATVARHSLVYSFFRGKLWVAVDQDNLGTIISRIKSTYYSLHPKLTPKRHPVPGFPVSLITICM